MQHSDSGNIMEARCAVCEVRTKSFLNN